MKLLKLLLLLAAIGLGAYILLWLMGVVFTVLWYAFWIGLVLIGGAVGYKLFLGGGDEETKQLAEKRPTAISELENADRTLDEYKQKYLPKNQ